MSCLIVLHELLIFLVLLPDDVALNFLKTNYCHPH